MESLDRVFDLLSEERRRFALYFLEQQDAPVSVDAVAEQVAEWENTGTTTVPEGKFDHVEVELLHQDLPKAANAEYVKYDPDAGLVEIVDSPPEFDAFLAVAKVIERPNRNP